MTKRFPFVVLAVVLGAASFAACGGRQRGKPGQISAPDRGRATSVGDAGFDGREDREASETAGPGAILPNVRRVYQILGTGEDRRKVLVCREIDTNLDGIKDVVRTFNDKGEALHEEADSNYDGKIDTWITFAAGRIAKQALDTDGDGLPDVWKYYTVVDNGGQAERPTNVPIRLSRIQRDTNRDGKVDVWEFYLAGRLERMGVDVDFDGHVDRWDHDEVARRAADAAEKEATKSEGAAKTVPDAGAEDGGAGDDTADAGAAKKRKK
jgi:hypothetical protein